MASNQNGQYLRRGLAMLARHWRKFKRSVGQLVIRAWPSVWPVIRSVDDKIPRNGLVRAVFDYAVFTLPWHLWYRSAYIPQTRDVFFEYILTFFYRYPIRPGDVVVQVGASFGEETMRFARAVGTQGRVIAIEPEADNLSSLRSKFGPNSYPQVSIVQGAAWSSSGALTLLVAGEREHRLAEISSEDLSYEWWGTDDSLAESRYSRTAKVAVDTVDNFLRPFILKRIDFVLVETNGSELQVVQGMNEALPITKRLGVRGHVKRDGAPIYVEIGRYLGDRGFSTAVSPEGMVLAERAGPILQTEVDATGLSAQPKTTCD
jgi:FkbM family methyltransferase